MAGIVTKYAAKKMLGKQMDQYKDKKVAGGDDPFFVEIEDPRRPGKLKKVKKQIPDYIPEKEAIILAKMRRRAYRLDMSLFSIAGIRFGWSSVIGLIPGFGDAIDALLALLLVYRCNEITDGLGSAWSTMIWNVVLDFGIGLVPILGDVADAAFRANTRNLRVLEKVLDKRYKPDSLKKAEAERKKAARASQIEYRPTPPATVYEDFSDEENERLPMHRQDVEPRRPEAARVPTETRGGEVPERKKSVLRKESKREKRSDLEMAESRQDRRY